MMLPTGASSFAESMQIGAEVYHSLKVRTSKEVLQSIILRRIAFTARDTTARTRH
jgi:enolase